MLHLWHSGRARENGRWHCGDATSQGYSRRSVGVTFEVSVTRQALPPITLACFLQPVVTIEVGQKVLPRGLAVPKTATPLQIARNIAEPQHFDASPGLKQIPGFGAAPRLHRNPLDDISRHPLHTTVIQPCRPRIGMSGQILDISQWNTLFQQIGNGCHPKRMRGNSF